MRPRHTDASGDHIAVTEDPNHVVTRDRALLVLGCLKRIPRVSPATSGNIPRVTYQALRPLPTALLSFLESLELLSD